MRSQIVFIFLTLCGASLSQGQGCVNLFGLDEGCAMYAFLGFCDHYDVPNFCYKSCHPVECDVRPCANLPTISSHGYNEPNSTTYLPGTLVEYMCNDGYILEGPRVNICFIDDKWINGAPTCVPACPTPPVNSALYVESSGLYREGDSVYYHCVNPSAAIVGDRFSTCVKNNTVLSWSLDTLPTCVTAGSCGPPPMIAVDGLNPEFRNYVSGSVATYQCRGSLVLIGSSSTTCINGSWTEPAPICYQAGSCGPPPMIAVGGVNPEFRNYASGSVATYKCRINLVLEGSSSTTCINGSWTEPAPICFQDCVDFQDCTIYVKFNYCTHVLYQEQTEVLCRKSCGLCSSCSSPPTGDFVIAAPSGPFVQGSRVHYTCASGTFDGADSNLCLGDGVWLNESPVCFADCPNLPTDANGSNLPSGTTHSHGTTVQYSCDTGYILFPPSENTCNDGSWSESSAGVCSKICEDFPQVHEHLVASSNAPFYLAGDSLNFTCSSGILEGSATVTCSASGTWSSFPTCRAVGSCGSPPMIAVDGLNPVPTYYASGSVATYQCRERRILAGSNSTTCINGSWTEPAPICYQDCVDYLDCTIYVKFNYCTHVLYQGQMEELCRKSCGLCSNCISPPIGVFVIAAPAGPFVQGSRVHYTCASGTLDGADSNLCLDVGVWLNESPVCHAGCGPPPINNRLLITTVPLPEFVEGAMVEYGCRFGMTLDPTTSVCQSNAEWSLTDLPNCFV